MSDQPRALTIRRDAVTDGQFLKYDQSQIGGQGGIVSVEMAGLLEILTIHGSESITDLAIGTATEITVDHSGDADFSNCEYPRITAPAGVRVTVLASGVSGDSTDGGQFVLFIENISYSYTGYGYGGGDPDLILNWTRTGEV